jgi:hypothetical protein
MNHPFPGVALDLLVQRFGSDRVTHWPQTGEVWIRAASDTGEPLSNNLRLTWNQAEFLAFHPEVSAQSLSENLPSGWPPNPPNFGP